MNYFNPKNKKGFFSDYHKSLSIRIDYIGLLLLSILFIIGILLVLK